MFPRITCSRRRVPPTGFRVSGCAPWSEFHMEKSCRPEYSALLLPACWMSEHPVFALHFALFSLRPEMVHQCTYHCLSLWIPANCFRQRDDAKATEYWNFGGFFRTGFYSFKRRHYSASALRKLEVTSTIVTAGPSIITESRGSPTGYLRCCYGKVSLSPLFTFFASKYFHTHFVLEYL
jgi:hypothetical protein